MLSYIAVCVCVCIVMDQGWENILGESPQYALIVMQPTHCSTRTHTHTFLSRCKNSWVRVIYMDGIFNIGYKIWFKNRHNPPPSPQNCPFQSCLSTREDLARFRAETYTGYEIHLCEVGGAVCTLPVCCGQECNRD